MTAGIYRVCLDQTRFYVKGNNKIEVSDTVFEYLKDEEDYPEEKIRSMAPRIDRLPENHPVTINGISLTAGNWFVIATVAKFPNDIIGKSEIMVW